MARSYRRDSSGRFSGGGGGGGSKGVRTGGGTLAARSSLKRSRGKLATNQTSAQRGAVTRASNKLKASKTENQRQLTAKRSGVIGKPKGLKPSVTSRMAAAAATKRPAKMSKAAPNRIPKAVQAIARAAAATFTAGQAARRGVDRAMRGRKRR